MTTDKILELRDLLNHVLASAALPWWEWDIPTNRVIFNDLKVTMLGYDPADFQDAGYEAFTDLLHPDDYDATMQAMRDHLNGSAPIYQIDYRIRNSQGHWQWYMDRGLTLDYSDKKPVRLRGLVIDLGREFSETRKNERLFELIRQSLQPLKQIDALLTICAVCTNYKLTDKIWIPVSEDFRKLLQRPISHGICPSCIRKLYPDDADAILAGLEAGAG